MPVRASIVDVARAAGVSVATVSRALRGLPNVSASTRERVFSAADQLEYTASPLAAALVTGRTRSVGVLASPSDRRFFTEAVRGVEEGLLERGYDLVLYVLPEGSRRDRFFAGLPMRRRIDALVLAGLRLTGAELASLRQLQLPIAGVGEAVDDVHTERIDDEAAARFAVQHLIDLGHTRIAMIGGTQDAAARSAVVGRARGFRSALAEAGLPPARVLDGGRTLEDGAEAMSELLAGGTPPTAVFCPSDELAFGALQAVSRAGLRCPESISVIGFGDHELAGAFGLTTIAQSISEQGAAAARWLTAGLDRSWSGLAAGSESGSGSGSGSGAGREVDQPVTADVLHPVRLVLRGSTAAFAGSVAGPVAGSGAVAGSGSSAAAGAAIGHAC